MFGGRLVWDKMFTGHLVGGRSIQAPFSVLGLLTKSTLPALSRSTWQRKMSRQYPTHLIHQRLPQQTLFSLSKCGSELAGFSLSQDPFKTSWVTIMRTTSEHEFAMPLAMASVLQQVHLNWRQLP